MTSAWEKLPGLHQGRLTSTSPLEQLCAVGEVSNDGTCCGTVKLRRLADELSALGMRHELLAPSPVERSVLSSVHEPSYVDSVLNGSPPNSTCGDSTSSSDAVLDELGLCHSAALAALERGVAAALTRWAHDAFWDSCGRGCPFNGIMVSAVQLLREQRVQRVAVIDMSPQYGSGTQSIVERLGLTRSILHVSFGKRFQFRRQAQLYLARARMLESEFVAFRPDLLYYQAAAGSHVESPVGGVLGTDQMRRRDATVFAIAQHLGIPVVWNLDGEAAPAPPLRVALDIHVNTFREAWRAFSADPFA